MQVLTLSFYQFPAVRREKPKIDSSVIFNKLSNFDRDIDERDAAGSYGEIYA